MRCSGGCWSVAVAGFSWAPPGIEKVQFWFIGGAEVQNQTRRDPFAPLRMKVKQKALSQRRAHYLMSHAKLYFKTMFPRAANWLSWAPVGQELRPTVRLAIFAAASCREFSPYMIAISVTALRPPSPGRLRSRQTRHG